MSTSLKFDSPITAPEIRVPQAWIDYNGHMNVAYYVLAFDHCVDHLLDSLGLGESYAATGVGSTFTLQSHVLYLAEVGLDDPLRITLQLLDSDNKRLHYFMQMYHAEKGFLSATCEQVGVHVDMKSRRSADFPDTSLARLRELATAHAGLERPQQAGAAIGLRKK